MNTDMKEWRENSNYFISRHLNQMQIFNNQKIIKKNKDSYNGFLSLRAILQSSITSSLGSNFNKF